MPALVSVPLTVLRLIEPEPPLSCEMVVLLVSEPAPSVASARLPLPVDVSWLPDSRIKPLALAGANVRLPPVSVMVPPRLMAVVAAEATASVSVVVPSVVRLRLAPMLTPMLAAAVLEPDTVMLPAALEASELAPTKLTPYLVAVLVLPVMVLAPVPTLMASLVSVMPVAVSALVAVTTSAPLLVLMVSAVIAIAPPLEVSVTPRPLLPVMVPLASVMAPEAAMEISLPVLPPAPVMLTTPVPTVATVPAPVIAMPDALAEMPVKLRMPVPLFCSVKSPVPVMPLALPVALPPEIERLPLLLVTTWASSA
ncbi:MAG: hypothetical protein ACRYGK_17945 [Janthinobacterium lividum]